MTVSPEEKFKEELQKLIRYWVIEFELSHWGIVGVLFDIAVDALYSTDDENLFGEEEDDEDDED